MSESRVYTISDSSWTGISCTCCQCARAKRKKKNLSKQRPSNEVEPMEVEEAFARVGWCEKNPRKAAERIAELEALLRRADCVVIWEIVMPDGRAFQERVEEALGVVSPAKYSAKER